MKKVILLSLVSIVLFACGSKENGTSVDTLIETKNINELKNKRTALQADLAKIDEALASLEKKTDEALVEVMTVKDTVFNHYLEIQGNVDTKENILIQPEVPGALVTLNVKAGQSVGKGQILGRVDDGGMSQQLASIQTQYELAKTTFERQKRLWDQKIGSEIQYLQAQTQMVSLQKSVAQMKAQLEKTVIRAPFTGVIDEVFVERGQIVSANPQGLMRIVNLSSMYVSTQVPETYVGKVKVGTPVQADITSVGKTYQGKIRQVGKSINPANRSFGIEVSVPNPESLLRPNQVAKLKIVDYTNKSAIVVPASIIQQDAEGNKFVYVVNNASGNTGTAKKVMVKLGQSSNNFTEILSGINKGEVVVSEGANTVSEGMKLTF
ncbi:efflux RND transporter periplasmic adaptor subunit [Flavobacterium amniphilum]|uniref:efflux RND transporter periplasmic adaptor subunit n=1 Tax=Flavobacterium amniphilum TaxID=1834035 RepID=UPI00202A1246|nr:efflux RND transporter periplasmic adaptor subunit [Flavobacterium amniphilum]MCL9807138.1 efflux RND transporter periplasmic adaptor subunit [Flavobacterium amniphilum]